MANEIQVTVAMQVNKGYLQHSQVPGTQLYTMTGTKCDGGAQTVTTSHVALNIGSLSSSTVGWAYFRNTSTTNGEDIAIGVLVSSTFYPLVGLKPGEVALFRLNTDVATAQTPYVKAAAGTASSPVLQYWIAED
jgi:hypothetical protein